MNRSAFIFKRLLKRKIATCLFITASLAAFATLGDKPKAGEKFSFSSPVYSSKNFSLRSGYNYKSNNLFSSVPDRQVIMLNTVTTYQKGNATYVMPLKKQVLLNKVKFNPAQ